MNKSQSHISYVVVSDIHLGHRKNPTERITNNLKNTLLPLFEKGFQILFIAGDLFDRLLDNTMSDNTSAKLWIFWLLQQCEKHQVKLRVLEGTPSHDRKQSSEFDTIYHIASSSIDYKYIPYLYIEYIEDLNINVLYVPDEWHTDPQETFKQVKTLLKEKALDQVDIAIMHGQFGYQLKNVPDKIPRHQEDQYLGIVKYMVHIGHVHQYSQFERIIAQGSFDRLAHGEEDAKGLVWANIYKEGTFDHFFIENKHALIFKTILIKNQDYQTAIEELDKKISKYPEGSYIRIKAKKNHPLFLDFNKVELRYLRYYLSRQISDQKEEYKTLTNIDTGLFDYTAFAITKENIGQLLKEELQKESSFQPTHWTYFNKVLTDEGVLIAT